MNEPRRAGERRARLSCLCLFAAVGCAFATVQLGGWAEGITGAVTILLCGAGYLLIR